MKQSLIPLDYSMEDLRELYQEFKDITKLDIEEYYNYAVNLNITLEEIEDILYIIKKKIKKGELNSDEEKVEETIKLLGE